MSHSEQNPAALGSPSWFAKHERYRSEFECTDREFNPLNSALSSISNNPQTRHPAGITAGFTGQTPPAHALHVLALVPPDQKGIAPSRYTFLSEELTALADRGIAIHTATPYVAQTKSSEGIQIHPLPGAGDVRATLRGVLSLRDKQRSEMISHDSWITTLRVARHQEGLQEIIRRESIDLIYSPFAWPAGTAGVPAAISTRIPVVVGLRGADILIEPAIGYGQMLHRDYARRFTKALNSASHVIAVSQALVDAAIALGCADDRVSVILKGGDLDHFSPRSADAARQQLELPNRPTILFVGNFVRSKGIGILVDAFSSLHVEFPEWQLVLCGDGPELASMRHRVTSLGINDHVRFPGRIARDVIPSYFQAADLFVLPSLTEGSGNVLVEAAASGRPAVGADVGGIPDYIDDGVTGLLFEKGNSDDLAEKIKYIITNPDAAREMGAAARHRAEQKHRYDDMIDQMLAVFTGVLKKQGVRS